LLGFVLLLAACACWLIVACRGGWLSELLTIFAVFLFVPY
jgi:hypothetical protein